MFGNKWQYLQSWRCSMFSCHHSDKQSLYCCQKVLLDEPVVLCAERVQTPPLHCWVIHSLLCWHDWLILWSENQQLLNALWLGHVCPAWLFNLLFLFFVYHVMKLEWNLLLISLQEQVSFLDTGSVIRQQFLTYLISCAGLARDILKCCLHRGITEDFLLGISDAWKGLVAQTHCHANCRFRSGVELVSALLAAVLCTWEQIRC